jgi:hypothetical protein
MHQMKPELRRQDLDGIHLPSFRFSWKLKKLCRVDFFVFESRQTGVKSLGKTITSSAVCHEIAYFQPFSNVISINAYKSFCMKTNN